MPESSTTTWAVISPPTDRLHAAGKADPFMSVVQRPRHRFGVPHAG
jgi:hypothetical protein